MISYICLLATVFANLSCADDMDNSKFDNMIPYGKQEVSYTYPKGEGNLRVLTFNISLRADRRPFEQKAITVFTTLVSD